ncbi:MAG: glycosyltransferase family 2 protein [Candidatus Cloacimonetes bacterium]|nr:glycosyltransferase family 2 protein [Candidatus Cloacimonadota bacterium]
MIYVFWISVFLIFYHLFFYGIILTILALFKKNEKIESDLKPYPTITVLCPAYNEEDVIEEKIKSFLNLDYPKNKISMIVISDDSIDRTNEIVQNYAGKYNNIKLVIQKQRLGKPSGHNMVEPTINSDYVLSTDANSLFHKDALKYLVKSIPSDPKIGIVSGELKLISNSNDSGEGLYWKYESYIKKLESKYHSIIGSNGSIFLIKRELFTQIHPASVDDFERTLHIIIKGFVGKYQPKALVYEKSTEKPSDELKRKIRIISREWFALKRNSKLLNPFLFSKISWMLFSHKLLRWTLFLWAALILFSNILLINKSVLLLILFLFQILIYLIGIIEIILETRNRSVKIFKLPGYFVVMVYASFMAFIMFLKGTQYATWNTIREEK